MPLVWFYMESRTTVLDLKFEFTDFNTPFGNRWCWDSGCCIVKCHVYYCMLYRCVQKSKAPEDLKAAINFIFVTSEGNESTQTTGTASISSMHTFASSTS